MSERERTDAPGPRDRIGSDELGREEAQLLGAIVEASDDAVISKTLDGRIRSWNAAATRLFGYTSAEAVGRSITLIIPRELHAEEQRLLEKLERGERIEHFETIRITKHGNRIPISLTISPVRNSRGQIIGVSKIARDISRQKTEERALREREQRSLAEVSALAALNEFGSRLWRTRALEQGLNEMLGAVIDLLAADKGNVQLLDAERGVLKIVAQRGFDARFLEAFREVSPADGTACGRALEGKRRVIIEDIEDDTDYAPFRAAARAAGYRSVISVPLVGADGTPLGVLSTHFSSVHTPSELELRCLDLYVRQASDFIQRCGMELALRASETALLEADRRKDEFLALIAHELRNPLASIRYALATLRKAYVTPEQRTGNEEMIERQVAHMSRLLEDLLDVSRIKRGMLELRMVRTELASVLEAAIEAAKPILDAKGHTLTLSLPPAPVYLEVDPTRLSQVFSNLLINAAKYTNGGGDVRVRAIREGTEVVVAIRDNGIGISKETLSRLFAPFSQAAPDSERSEGGLGVGLSLVRGLVTLHGGQVEAHSDGVGCGSEFIVRLPVGRLKARRLNAELSQARPPLYP